MKKYACKYVVLQFSPYSETEEFANVGVLLYSKKYNIFEYKLDRIDTGNRVTKFFHIKDKSFYSFAMQSYEKELRHMKDQVAENLLTAEAAFELLVRPRATLLRYSDPRVVLTNDISMTLNDVFKRMVKHKSESQIKTRKNLNVVLKGQLDLLKLSRPFGQYDFKRNGFVARYNLTQLNDNQQPIKIIQPIDLSEKFTAQDVWKEIDSNEVRLSRMKKLDLLPNDVLLPFSIDSNMPEEALSVWDSVQKEWDAFGLLVDIKDSETIENFAIQ